MLNPNMRSRFVRFNARWLTIGSVVGASVAFPLQAEAVMFSEVYVFGDSLSDVGNTFSKFSGVPEASQFVAPSPPYFQGRYSNGPVWVEYFAENLGLTPNPQTNFAYGGATTGLSPDRPIPSILEQVADYEEDLRQNNAKADSEALYVVWGGANDYLNAGITDPTVTVGNLAKAITSLTTLGAQNIAVFNLGDLGELPVARDPLVSTQLNQLTTFHNAGLADTVKSLNAAFSADIISVDINRLFDNAIANPPSLDLSNVTDACLNLETDPDSGAIVGANICDNPNEYLFWDGVHPTTATHQRIAQFAQEAIEAERGATVPEPGTMLGLSVLGVGGVLSRRKRQRQAAKTRE